MTTSPDFNTFERHSGILKAFAYRLTQHTEEAADLYQETAFRAFKNLDKFKPGTNFKAWSMTIMKNIFINNYRKKVKQRVVFDNTEDDFYINSGKNISRNQASSEIMMKELTAIIEELDEGLKIPFLMHYRGFKYQEIADKFELPLGTIKSRIFFARKALQEKVIKRYEHLETAREMF